MKQTILIASFLCISLTGYTQKTVSLESKRATKANISTNISLGGSYTTGNTEKGAISGNLQLAAIDSLKEFSFDAKYTYGENNNKMNQREYLTGLQYDYRPLSKISPFIRAELYSNAFRNIKYRVSGLTGIKYRYFAYKKDEETISDYSISGALSYDYEKYTSDAQSASRQKVRLSIRPKIKQKLANNIYLQSELFYKPKINYWSDYILHTISDINFLVNNNIYIKCSYEYKYENKPVTSNIKKTDTTLLISLGIKI